MTVWNSIWALCSRPLVFWEMADLKEPSAFPCSKTPLPFIRKVTHHLPYESREGRTHPSWITGDSCLSASVNLYSTPNFKLFLMNEHSPCCKSRSKLIALMVLCVLSSVGVSTCLRGLCYSGLSSCWRISSGGMNRYKRWWKANCHCDPICSN